MTLLHEITKVFKEGGIEHPRRKAEELMCDLLTCSRSELYDHPFSKRTEELEERAFQWAERRLKGEPLAYLSNKVSFYDCEIAVSPEVLIPRPETEVLVDKIVSCLKPTDLTGQVLWDMCCGSGCIGIAIKKALPALTVILSDCSQEAVDITVQNAGRNGVEVTCYVGDLFTPLKGMKTNYFVCNPPYISELEYLTLDREVKDFEPRGALVSGKKGLEFYERIALELPLYLKPGGKGWFEIGYQQGFAVQHLFQGSPWKRSQVENDWSGHNRFFFLEIE